MPVEPSHKFSHSTVRVIESSIVVAAVVAAAVVVVAAVVFSRFDATPVEAVAVTTIGRDTTHILCCCDCCCDCCCCCCSCCSSAQQWKSMWCELR